MGIYREWKNYELIVSHELVHSNENIALSLKFTP